MPSVEIGLLSDRIDEDEFDELLEELEDRGMDPLPEADESAGRPIATGIDEDAIAEFMDRLESHEVAAELFVPVGFEGQLESGGIRVASLSSLLMVLEEVAEDLDINDPDGLEEDDEEDVYSEDLDLMESRQRVVWRALYEGAQDADEHGLCLFISD
jgi:hypothetical protein